MGGDVSDSFSLLCYIIIPGRSDQWFAGYVFEEMIVFSEVSKELTQIGFDVIIHRGSNIKDSWTEISWENAKEGRNGEIKEI